MEISTAYQQDDIPAADDSNKLYENSLF